MSGPIGLGLVNTSERDYAVDPLQDAEISPERQDGQLKDPIPTNEALSQHEDSELATPAGNLHEASGLHDAIARTHISHSFRKASDGLHIDTHLDTPLAMTASRSHGTPTIQETPVSDSIAIQPSSTSPSSLSITGGTLKSSVSTSSMASIISQGSASTLTSPYLSAITDLTPLPSPVGSFDPANRHSWRLSLPRPSTPRSREGSMDEPGPSGKQMSPLATVKKKKGYGRLLPGAVEAPMTKSTAVEENAERHGRNRSISDFVPEHLQNLKQRHVTYGPGDTANFEAQEHRMQREENQAAKRGLENHAHEQRAPLPTPPTSISSVGESDEAEDEHPRMEDGSTAEYLEIRCGMHNKRRKFRQLRQLGQGTFSKVMLATHQKLPAHLTPEIEEHLDPHTLVAVKIVEQGPAGGADEKRIEIGLKREVEMLKSLSHPSIIHIKACEYQEHRALLVLTYCPGGDLFEFASEKRDLLPAPMVRRIFSELVGAVRYLHTNWIVHRDIKLENVLVNYSASALSAITDPCIHPRPIVTLTDLGLSRRIPEPPESPLLTTRCGSEDYAAPELLLGERYDGRLTDGWALGVLLYALMEGRLPFDAPPGVPARSRNTHRIARCSWIWCRFGDEDGDWEDRSRGAEEFAGARKVVEGLLRKVRMGRKTLEDIEGIDWVREGIRVPGGLTVSAFDEDGVL